MTSSIKMELIPGMDTYLDKKSFRWDLIDFGTEELAIGITFDHPEFISCDKIDSMKIIFSNNDLYIVPTDSSGAEPLPDGYEIVIKLPP